MFEEELVQFSLEHGPTLHKASHNKTVEAAYNLREEQRVRDEEDGIYDDQDQFDEGGEMQLDVDEDETEQDASFASVVGLNSSLTSNNSSGSSTSRSNVRGAAINYGSRQSCRAGAQRSLISPSSSSSSSSADAKISVSDIRRLTAAGKDLADTQAKSAALKKENEKQTLINAASAATNKNLVAENKTETSRLKKLSREVSKIETKLECLQDEIAQQKNVLDRGQAEIKTTKQENKQLQLANQKLRAENVMLATENETLQMPRHRPRNVIKYDALHNLITNFIYNKIYL